MNIFEQMECADVMTVNNQLTNSFGWNPDDGDEDFCLSVYGVDAETGQGFEYYFDHSDLTSAIARGNIWDIKYSEGLGDTLVSIEFLKLTPVEGI